LTETTSGTTVTYAYDLNGNLTSKTGGGNTTSYTWDWRDLLLSVSESSGNTSYEYNGDGTRISKAQGGLETKYINDLGRSLVQVLMETDNAGTTQATYNYGNDLISMNRAAADSYYLYDGLGSTRQLTDSVESVTVSYTYESFGNLIASTGTSENTYGFTGEQQFKEADGLVFLRARYYDPGIGRFISRDPIGYIAGTNVYVYVKNDPVNYVDPFGLLGYSPWPGHPPLSFPPSPSCRAMAEEEFARESIPDSYMRHCTVSCRLTQRAGRMCAWAAGWWNELRPGRSGRSRMREGLRDNQTGRGCASDSGCSEEYESCTECCEARRGGDSGPYPPPPRIGRPGRILI
jgi:RHS repeat-associated protein